MEWNGTSSFGAALFASAYVGVSEWVSRASSPLLAGVT